MLAAPAPLSPSPPSFSPSRHFKVPRNPGEMGYLFDNVTWINRADRALAARNRTRNSPHCVGVVITRWIPAPPPPPPPSLCMDFIFGKSRVIGACLCPRARFLPHSFFVSPESDRLFRALRNTVMRAFRPCCSYLEIPFFFNWEIECRRVCCVPLPPSLAPSFSPLLLAVPTLRSPISYARV